ncbi:uncharacterized protein ARMOST_19915 [Armillaria ostoyae]|uniref:Uncharacterized protein n=1 Tax=Armillaria ostoyae TaxID=47428 RepID=A0A284S5W0_ARMOS|nr:uncharacterized protein ARMOST_19915 [Armillaria ostoyae]
MTTLQALEDKSGTPAKDATNPAMVVSSVELTGNTTPTVSTDDNSHGIETIAGTATGTETSGTAGTIPEDIPFSATVDETYVSDESQGGDESCDKGKGKMVEDVNTKKRKSESDAPAGEPTIMVDESGEMVMASAEAAASIYLAGGNSFAPLAEGYVTSPAKRLRTNDMEPSTSKSTHGMFLEHNETFRARYRVTGNIPPSDLFSNLGNYNA